MKKISIFIIVALMATSFNLFAEVNPATAWWNNEDFEGYEVGATFSGWTLGGGAGEPRIATVSNPTGTTNPSGNYFLLYNTNNTQLRTINKSFPALSGFIYVKSSYSLGTYASTYSFRDDTGAVVFEILGIGAKDGPNVAFTDIPAATVGLGKRDNWADVELILDLSNNKIVKLIAENSTLSKKSFTTSDVSLSTTHNGVISQLYIISRIGDGFDNTTIGQLIADNISALSGDAELQTLEDTDVTKSFSVTTISTAMGLELAIADLALDIAWSISDYGALSSSDQALVSLTRDSENYAAATLKTTSAIAANATITIKAKLGETELTKEVTLVAPSTDALKASLLAEITAAGALSAAVTDSNPYITGIKTTLATAIAAAQAVYDNETAALAVIAQTIADLQAAETAFSTAIAPYNEYVAYIATVQAAHDAEIREAAFFTAIKATLSSAIATATAARSTIASTDDIIAATSTLAAALAAFNADVPAYASLETAIATVAARITAVTPRIGVKFLNFLQDKVDELSAAKATAETALSSAETVAALNEAITTLNAALSIFNETGRVAPAAGSYKIYSYGVADGTSKDTKKVIYGDGTAVKYSDSETEPDNTEWIITQTAPNVYAIKNTTLNLYLNAGESNSVILTSESASFTLPENTGTNSASDISTDAGYFLYGIVGSRALEIAADGALQLKNNIASRWRFAFQFEEIAVTGVELDKTAETLTIAETLQLTATLAPANATNPAVTWTTDDEDIATVSETGLVTAVGVGTATITATTEDGDFTATCEVTVTQGTGLETVVNAKTVQSTDYYNLTGVKVHKNTRGLVIKKITYIDGLTKTEKVFVEE